MKDEINPTYTLEKKVEWCEEYIKILLGQNDRIVKRLWEAEQKINILRDAK